MSHYSDEGKPSIVATSGGLGFPGALTIIFVVLKLCKVIEWNWFWVLSPMIFSAALWLLMIVIVIIFALLNQN